VLQRGEKIELLVDKTDSLNQNVRWCCALAPRVERALLNAGIQVQEELDSVETRYVHEKSEDWLGDRRRRAAHHSHLGLLVLWH
jgi:hypothetical protein